MSIYRQTIDTLLCFVRLKPLLRIWSSSDRLLKKRACGWEIPLFIRGYCLQGSWLMLDSVPPLTSEGNCKKCLWKITVLVKTTTRLFPGLLRYSPKVLPWRLSTLKKGLTSTCLAVQDMSWRPRLLTIKRGSSVTRMSTMTRVTSAWQTPPPQDDVREFRKRNAKEEP